MCKGHIKSVLQTRWADADHYKEGGNSWVYKATDSGNQIAIKVFRRFNSPERYPRFLQEIKTMDEISAISGIASIVAINQAPPETLKKCGDIKTIDDLAYFAMPLYQGNLKDNISFFGSDDGTSAVEVMLQISRTIKRLHDKNLAHRDLKPENVLFDTQGNYIVSDFGLSIDLDNIPEMDQRLSGVLELIGSVSYRAPELLRGRLGANDHKPCDVYSIGRMLWALIYGQEPDMITDLEFEGIPVSACGRQIKKAVLLDDIVRGATTLDPRFRIKIDDLIHDLENWQMENIPKSNESIINKLVNNPAAIAGNINKKVAESISTIHFETKTFLNKEVHLLLADLQQVIEAYRGYTGRGMSVEVRPGIGFVYPLDQLGITSEQKDPEAIGWVRINLGSVQYHLIDFAAYITVNLNDYAKQYYTVIACYIPAGQVPPDITPKLLYSKGRQFDYRDGNIRQEILDELITAFTLCDNLFRSQF